jgi:hypothetical protein
MQLHLLIEAEWSLFLSDTYAIWLNVIKAYYCYSGSSHTF